jgi:hypothetical protein
VDYILQLQEANMKLTITHQEKYSRGQLILRLFFGLIYIGIPHFFLLFFVGIWSAILSFITFWIVLFTAKFPESIFNFQIGMHAWVLKVEAVLGNLVDGYPAFFAGGKSDTVKLEVPRPERISRGLVILRLLFGTIYVGIPHGFCLFFRQIASSVLGFLAFWAILFVGRYPARWHAFNVGTYRWVTNISLYLGYFTDEYPKFSGKE